MKIFSLKKFNRWCEKYKPESINDPWAVESDGKEVIDGTIKGTPYRSSVDIWNITKEP